MRATALALVTALTLPGSAHGQEPADPAADTASGYPCDPLTDFGCVYTPGPGNTELRTVVDAAEWRRLPVSPLAVSGVTGLGAGTLSDRYGLVLGGASSLESTFELDGLDVSGVVWGGPIDASPVPLSLLGRTIIRRGGLGATLGGGSGGLVSLEAPRGDEQEGGADFYFGPIVDGSSLSRPAPSVIDWSSSRGDLVGHVWATGGLPRWNGRWFAGLGFRQTGATTTRVLHRMVDDDGDGAPDENADGTPILQPIETQELSSDDSALPVMVRVDLEPLAGQHIGVTGFVDWRRETYYDTIDGATAALARRDREVTTDLAATWRGRRGDSELRLLAGVHRHHWTSRSPYEDRNTIPGGYTRLPDGWLQHESQAVRDLCTDNGPNDDHPLIVNCPVAFYWGGGVGNLRDDPATRVVARAAGSHFLDIAGVHQLQVGLDLDQSTYVHHHEYSGGHYLQFLDEWRHVELGDGPDLCAGMPCRWLDAADQRSTTRSVAAYGADDWSPIDQVTVSVGARLETQEVEGLGTLSDLAPRLGVAWDPVGRGRSRLYAATGAYVARLPLYFNDRAFAGVDAYSRTVDPDTQAVVDEGVIEFVPTPVQAGVGPLRVNEAVAGGELALGQELRAGMAYMRRELGRILEDASGEIGNPYGRRDLDELSVELRSNPERPLMLRASYTFTRLHGDWQGFVDDQTRAVQPGLLTTFDAPDLAVNADGPLPATRPHRLAVSAAYRQPIRGGELTVGLRAVALSGTPVSALGNHPRFGFGEVHIIPRGGMGRTPPASSMSARLQYARGRLAGFVDIFNFFDHQEPVRTDSIYTTDDVRPIVGGDPTDLPFLKRLDFGGAETGIPAGRNPSFGQAAGRYVPWALWLGLRLSYD